MSLRRASLFTIVAITAALGAAGLHGQDADLEATRRVKNKVPPAYPELARKMGLTGTVKVEVVVSPNGAVKEASN